MHFLLAATSLLFTTALAAPTAVTAPSPTPSCVNPAHCGNAPPDPSTYDNVNISDYYLRKNTSGVQSVSFTLNGPNATDLKCSRGATPDVPSGAVTCGDSKYSFGVIKSETDSSGYGLAVYRETGLG